MVKHPVLPVILLAAAFLLSGCGALFPAPPATTLPPEMIGTEIVKTQTSIAALTVTNAPSPTNTLHPSRTPRPTETPRPTYTASITPSPTVTFVITIPAIIISGGSGSATEGLITYPWKPLPGYQAANGCDLVALSPKWGQVFAKGASFDAQWTFANYGPYVWNEHEVDFKYVGGQKMQVLGDVYDLPDTVLPGGRIQISVNMISPLTKGNFTSTWLLSQGNMFFCRVSISITTE